MASGAARCGAPGDAFAAPAPDPGGPGVISCNRRSAQRQEMVFVNLFDVRIHAIQHRRNRRRRSRSAGMPPTAAGPSRS
jgi:hypothetical protein